MFLESALRFTGVLGVFGVFGVFGDIGVMGGDHQYIGTSGTPRLKSEKVLTYHLELNFH